MQQTDEKLKELQHTTRKIQMKVAEQSGVLMGVDNFLQNKEKEFVQYLNYLAEQFHDMKQDIGRIKKKVNNC